MSGGRSPKAWGISIPSDFFVMQHLLICPNAFKASLSASEAALLIAEGVRKSDLTCVIYQLPIADGGDGTLEVVTPYLELEWIFETVQGPMGSPVSARYGINRPKGLAVIELAEASGIRHVEPSKRNVWAASTYGTGQLLRKAMESGAEIVYLTVGGSATVDGGLGLLAGMGVRLLDGEGTEISPQLSALDQVESIDVTAVLPLLRNVSIKVLCDVDNPLLGSRGAAAVFGPQKGAREADVEALEKKLAHWAMILHRQFGKHIHQLPGAGAAGGVAGMMHAAFGAQLVNGADLVLSWAGFDRLLAACDWVITGEGRIDEQTEFGKGPGLVASRAHQLGKPVIGLSGGVAAGLQRLPHFDVLFPIINEPIALNDAMQLTRENLERTAFQIGQLIHRSQRRRFSGENS